MVANDLPTQGARAPTAMHDIDIVVQEFSIFMQQKDWLIEVWWRIMMTSSFSALLAHCAGNSSATGEFPSQRPVTRSFDVFFREAVDFRRHRAHYDVMLRQEKDWLIEFWWRISASANWVTGAKPWTYADLLLFGPQEEASNVEIKYNIILLKESFENVVWKMLPILPRPHQ